MSNLKSLRIVILLVAATLIFAGLAQAKPLQVKEGYNFLATSPGSYTTISLPGGFFGEKDGVESDPIVELRIQIEGRPIGRKNLSGVTDISIEAGSCHSRGGHHHCHENAVFAKSVDTITRSGAVTLDKINDRASATLEVIAVSMRTPAGSPLEVTYGGKSPSYFDVILNNAPDVKQDLGTVWFNRTRKSGGVLEVEMPVNFEVSFTDSYGTLRFGPVNYSTVLASKDNRFVIKN